MAARVPAAVPLRLPALHAAVILSMTITLAAGSAAHPDPGSSATGEPETLKPEVFAALESAARGKPYGGDLHPGTAKTGRPLSPIQLPHAVPRRGGCRASRRLAALSLGEGADQRRAYPADSGLGAPYRLILRNKSSGGPFLRGGSYGETVVWRELWTPAALFDKLPLQASMVRAPGRGRGAKAVVRAFNLKGSLRPTRCKHQPRNAKNDI